MSFSILLLLSIITGLVGALSGMGGSVILVPTLTFFGIDIKQAIAISNLSTVALSSSATPIHLRRHIPSLKAAVFLEIFAVIGSLAGALVTLVAQRPLLFIISGSALLVFGVLLWAQRAKKWQPVIQQDSCSRWLRLEGSYYDDVEGRTISYRGSHAALAGLLMCGVGVNSGLLGIGAGALAVLINQEVLGLPPKVSLTTSSLIIGTMSLAGANVYLEAGLINPHLVAPAVLGVPLGTLIGSKLFVHLPDRIVRTVFLVVLAALGLVMVTHGIRGG